MHSPRLILYKKLTIILFFYGSGEILLILYFVFILVSYISSYNFTFIHLGKVFQFIFRIFLSRFQTVQDYSLSSFCTCKKANQLYDRWHKVSVSILSIAIFGFYELSIQACQNCHIVIKLGMMIPDTVRFNVESIATL